METKFDIACLGEAMVEFNQIDATQPNYRQGFGGDTSNAVIAAARAGARTAYLTRLGADAWGDALMQLWQNESVNTEGIERSDSAHTAVYFVTHSPEGHQFSYLRKDSAASKMDLVWLDRFAKPVITASRWLHVSGISLAISESARVTTLAAMRFARSQGIKVSLDSNLRLKLLVYRSGAANDARSYCP